MINNKLNDIYENSDNKYNNITIINNSIDFNNVIYNVKNGQVFKKIINYINIGIIIKKKHETIDERNDIKTKIDNFKDKDEIKKLNELYELKIKIIQNYQRIIDYKNRFLDKNFIMDDFYFNDKNKIYNVLIKYINGENNFIDNILNNQQWFKLYYNIPQCADKRLIQFTGTCWLNTIFNSLLMNDKILYYIKKHNEIEFDTFKNIDINNLFMITYYDEDKKKYEINILNDDIPKNGFITIDKLYDNNILNFNDYQNKLKILYYTSYNYGNFIDYETYNGYGNFINDNNDNMKSNYDKCYKIQMENKDIFVNILKDIINNNDNNDNNNKTIVDIINKINLDNFNNVILYNFIQNIKKNISYENINDFYYIKLSNKILKDNNIEIDNKCNIIYILLRDFNLNIILIQMFTILDKIKLNDYNDYLIGISYFIKMIALSKYYSDEKLSLYKNNVLISTFNLENNFFEFNGFSSSKGIHFILSYILNDYIDTSIYQYSIDKQNIFLIFISNQINNMNKKLYYDNRLNDYIIDNDKKYILSCCGLSLLNYKTDGTYNNGHGICGFVCNNKYFIYDSHNKLY